MATLQDTGFDRLITELETKCALTREKISDLIRQKRNHVGGGYLTDRGALFLVAADLGIILEYGHEGLISLAKLSNQNGSVSVICRILSFGSPKSFTRKSDAARGALARVILYDDTTTITSNFWDKAAIRIAEGDEFRPGALVKITGAYLRAGQDGSLSLNIGESGSFESCNDETYSRRVKAVTDMVTPLAALPENGVRLIVSGIVDGDVKKFSFSRSDGTSSEYTSFYICDSRDRNLKRRVVLWGFSNPAISMIKDPDPITLVNVKAKLATFQNTVSPEIHGDDTTVILERWSETKQWLKHTVQSFKDSNQSAKSSGGTVQTILPFVARVVSIRKSEDKLFALLLDSTGRRISATITAEAANKGLNLGIDTLLICKPETQDLESGKATFSKIDSLVVSGSIRKDIPLSKSLVAPIEQVGQTGIVSVNVMCLTDPLERDIQTREGLVRRSEITVADHTGEIKVYGWRSLSKLLEGYTAGDRILVSAVEVQTHEGKKFVVLKNYSVLSRIPA